MLVVVVVVVVVAVVVTVALMFLLVVVFEVLVLVGWLLSGSCAGGGFRFKASMGFALGFNRKL